MRIDLALAWKVALKGTSELPYRELPFLLPEFSKRTEAWSVSGLI